MYKKLIRPILFLFQPETIHGFVFFCLRIIQGIFPLKSLIKSCFKVNDPRLEKTIGNITFPNPVGLAAGLDKDAEVIDAMDALGFGFVEIGTSTPLPQAGNPKPRLFRLPKDKGLINRMGFNNKGIHFTIDKLKKRKSIVIVGANIGKNKITPNEQAENDYLKCFQELYPFADYFVVNVSSPNTPNLRELQEKEPLQKLLQKLSDENNKMPIAKPIFLKIAPDLSYSQIDEIIQIVEQTKIQGIVATNTTISRDYLSTPSDVIEKAGAGGLSGSPLKIKSTEIIKYIRKKSKMTLIGVGGIMSAEDALQKLEAGADLIQIYTGFIYQGPALVKKINKAILSKSKP